MLTAMAAAMAAHHPQQRRRQQTPQRPMRRRQLRAALQTTCRLWSRRLRALRHELSGHVQR